VRRTSSCVPLWDSLCGRGGKVGAGREMGDSQLGRHPAPLILPLTSPPILIHPHSHRVAAVAADRRVHHQQPPPPDLHSLSSLSSPTLICNPTHVRGSNPTYVSHCLAQLIDEIATNPKVVKYIDIPLQHISNLTLLAMNRPPAVGGTWFCADQVASGGIRGHQGACASTRTGSRLHAHAT
jgi:hypothetical protein